MSTMILRHSNRVTATQGSTKVPTNRQNGINEKLSTQQDNGESGEQKSTANSYLPVENETSNGTCKYVGRLKTHNGFLLWFALLFYCCLRLWEHEVKLILVWRFWDLLIWTSPERSHLRDPSPKKSCKASQVNPRKPANLWVSYGAIPQPIMGAIT